MKIKSFFCLFVILLIIIFSSIINEYSYQAIEVTDDCKIGIDINHNGTIKENEYFEISGITPFFCGKF